MSVLKNLSVFMAVFILSIVSAQNELELSSQRDLDSMDEIQELLRNVQMLYEMKIANKVQQGVAEEEMGAENDVQVDANGCSCSGIRCTCCKYIRVGKLNLNENCCLTVTYLSRNYGIMISLNLGLKTLFSEEISVRNPPPVCIEIPLWKRGGSICIQFYNLNIAKKSFSGCSMFLGQLLHVSVAKIYLGCFRMTFLNPIHVGTVELPYLDGQKTPVEGPEPLYLGDVPMEKIKSSGYRKN